MQEGMLFHTLCEPRAGFEIEQLICDLRESLDAPALRRAWECVMARHAVLRTSFRWQGLAAPVQQVWPQVALPWTVQDWSDLSVRDREEAFAAFLETDRVRGFNLSEAPLLRLTLFILGQTGFRLVWTFHHALLDGRSYPIVLREVFGLYDSFRLGEYLNLPEPRPYQEHVHWLREHNHQAEVFWRERLKGFSAPTELIRSPTAPEADSSIRHGAREITLSPSVTKALHCLAVENELTLNTIVQAAWAVLLSRYSGEHDVVFGATRSCRHSGVEGAESMVGVFINTLPLRLKVEPEMPLLPWLKDVRSGWVALRDHEHTPLVKIQSWSEVPADTPLFESLVVFEHAPLNTILRSAGGPWLEREFRLVEQPSYPLTLAAYGGDALVLKILFDPCRFDDTTIIRMLGHLKTLLGAMAAQPRQNVGALPLLTDEERHQLLIEWNQPQRPFPPEDCLHRLFETQVERTPNAIAVVSGSEQLTYRELNRRANEMASRLRRKGVGSETIVGICMEGSPALIAGIIGILKAGGAYLPIDAAWPRERIAFLLEDSHASLLLTQRSLLARLPSASAEIICSEEPASPDDAVGTNAPPNPAIVDPLAYVIYTSGSTGQPKGVMVTHDNVVRLFQSTEDWFRFDATDVWTLFHSPAFDFSVWEMWGALVHGGKLVIVPYSVSRAPELFYELLARERVTVLNQTPSAFRQLIRAEQELESAAPPLALRWIIFGGEALDPQSLRPWFDRHGDQQPQLVNMYGITETTVHVTYRPLTRADLDCGSVIGTPIPDLQLYILDERRQPVPIGVAGEIYVGGPGLARGYLHRPELTAERFVPHPFTNKPGARLYRTGDRARFLPGRDLEYLGRMDDQIKLRGFRIEPGEIESLLGQHPAVREAVVVVREDKPGDKRLVAYAVTHPPGPAPGELRRYLQERLPDYMLPSAVVVLDKLPLTSSGKTDRQALPRPDQPPTTHEFLVPRTKLERTVAGMWQELLGVKKVGLHDNFFEMGGHSLLLVQLHYRLQAALSRDVPITTLFQYPTVSALTKHLSESPARASRPARTPSRRMRELQNADV
jgi:amino acid adenylation domain-containing protein